MQYKIKKISGDASFREFYKIEKNSRSTILVKANKDKFRNLIIYAAINELLIKNKIKAPKLVQEYFVKNMMEIEDLGSHSFLENIKNKKNKFNDYKKLIELIIKLQKINFKKYIKFRNNKIIIKKHNLPELHKESDLFFDWYLKNNGKKKKQGVHYGLCAGCDCRLAAGEREREREREGERERDYITYSESIYI